MDNLKEAVGLVHKALEHGKLEGKDVAATLKDIATTLIELSVVVKPVAACSAVEYQAAIERGNVLCLECGEEVQSLGAHVLKAHGLSWGDYTTRFDHWFKGEGIEPRKAGATLSARRRDNAIMIGLGAKGQQPKKEAKVEPVKAEPVKELRRMNVKQMTHCLLPVLLEYVEALDGVDEEAYNEALTLYRERYDTQIQAEIEDYDRSINLK